MVFDKFDFGSPAENNVTVYENYRYREFNKKMNKGGKTVEEMADLMTQVRLNPFFGDYLHRGELFFFDTARRARMRFYLHENYELMRLEVNDVGREINEKFVVPVAKL